MENIFRYYRSENSLRRIFVEHDDYPWDPRKDCDNAGHMLVWWNKYNLGDEKESFTDPISYLLDLIKEKVTPTDIINFVLADKASVKIKQREKTKKYYLEKKRMKKSGWEYEDLKKEEYDIALEIIEDFFSYNDMWNLLKDKCNIVHLDLFAYEHGGISISAVKSNPYPDKNYDSGQAGYIWTDRETFEKICGKQSNKHWEEKALQVLKEEVKYYDMFLQGECYCLVTEEWDPMKEAWVSCDTTCGYYSDKWGEGLLIELAEANLTAEEMKNLVADPKDIGNIMTKIKVSFPATWIVQGEASLLIPANIKNDKDKIADYITELIKEAICANGNALQDTIKPEHCNDFTLHDTPFWKSDNKKENDDICGQCKEKGGDVKVDKDGDLMSNCYDCPVERF